MIEPNETITNEVTVVTNPLVNTVTGINLIADSTLPVTVEQVVTPDDPKSTNNFIDELKSINKQIDNLNKQLDN